MYLNLCLAALQLARLKHLTFDQIHLLTIYKSGRVLKSIYSKLYNSFEFNGLFQVEQYVISFIDDDCRDHGAP